MMTPSTQTSMNAQAALRRSCVQPKGWQGEGSMGGFGHGIDREQPRRLVANTLIKRPSLSQITAALTANLYPRRAFIE